MYDGFTEESDIKYSDTINAALEPYIGKMSTGLISKQIKATYTIGPDCAVESVSDGTTYQTGGKIVFGPECGTSIGSGYNSATGVNNFGKAYLLKYTLPGDSCVLDGSVVMSSWGVLDGYDHFAFVLLDSSA